MRPVSRLLLILACIAAVAVAAAQRLQLSYDLSAFLPPPNTAAQALLTQRLGQGPGAQLIFIELQPSSSGQAMALAAQLRNHPLVARVLPESFNLSTAAIPPVLWRHRLLLQDLPTSRNAWQEVLNQRIDDLMFAVDDDVLNLVAADPALTSVTALRDFSAAASQPAFDQGHIQYLMVETTAAGFDLTAQTELVAYIRTLVSDTPGAIVLGSPVYAVDLQQEVRYEATLFSSLAGFALLLLMIARYRSIYRVVSVALPLAAGAVSGLLALTLVFDSVHGITLAFGFTLLGVTIDYPLHLLTHAESGHTNGNRNIWPVLRLGIVSTLIAYGAFIFSGTPGLKQLGVFAFAGVIVAAFTAAWISAPEMPTTDRIDADDTPSPQALRWWPAFLVLTISSLALSGSTIFNDDLSSLTPVDAKLLAADAQVRRQLGVTDIRHLVSVRADNEEQTLQASEAVVRRLQPLVEANLIEGVQSVTAILPSQHTQRQRRQDLAGPSRNAFEAAVAQLPLDADAFTPFLQAWQQEQNSQHILTVTALQQDEQLTSAVNTLFFNDGHTWNSLIFLRGLQDPAAVRDLFAADPGVDLVDLKATSEQLVRDYRRSLVHLLLIALILILAILGLRLPLRRAMWLLTNAAAAVSAAAASSAAWQAGLSLFDLMALTLVAGLGLDYVLFYSREQDTRGAQATASAVFICALSSLVVFGILSLSSIPVLRGIGTTVFIGVLAAYLLARFGRYTKAGE